MLSAMNKLLMEENDRLQKQVSHLVQENGYFSQHANPVFSTPEASIGFHTDCGFSYILSHPHLGEYLGLTGARLNGKELVGAGLATHFAPSEKMLELEKHLISLNSGDINSVKSTIEKFSLDVQIDEESILNKQSTINECFSKESVEEIIKSLEAKREMDG